MGVFRSRPIQPCDLARGSARFAEVKQGPAIHRGVNDVARGVPAPHKKCRKLGNGLRAASLRTDLLQLALRIKTDPAAVRGPEGSRGAIGLGQWMGLG